MGKKNYVVPLHDFDQSNNHSLATKFLFQNTSIFWTNKSPESLETPNGLCHYQC